MKKLMLGITACTLILSSCAKNELIDSLSLNDGKIRFSASKALNSAKAADGNPFNSTSDFQMVNGTTPGSFKVVGFGTATPISGVEYVNREVTWTPATQSWEYANEPFWPDQALDFYAYSPVTIHGGTATIDNLNGVKVEDFKVGLNNTQVDLLVASALVKTKEQRTPLLFKHALTQVLFKAMKITNSGLNVRINDVEIVNINSKGTFISGKTPYTHFKQDCWGTTSEPTSFNAAPNAVSDGSKSYLVDVEGVAGTTPARNAGFIQTDATNNALLMIPQNFNAWVPGALISTGAYIKISAAIWTTLAASENVALHGTVDAGGNVTYDDIYIPVASLGLNTNDKTNAPLGQWVPGRRINYIITFGDTGSGSGGGGYNDDGTPVLVPIKFTAQVEDWVDQDVPLLTATFDGKSDAVNGTFIDGFTTNLLNDIKSPLVPKKYNATIAIGGTLKEATSLLLSAYQESGNGSTFKFLPGTVVTYDFDKTLNRLNFGGFAITAITPTGWTINKTSIDGSATNTTIVITRQAWSNNEIKASITTRANSTIYASSEASTNELIDASWAPIGLTYGQTLSIKFLYTSISNPLKTGESNSWVWNATDKIATYIQP